MTQVLQECSSTSQDSTEWTCHDSLLARQRRVQDGAMNSVPTSTPTPQRRASAIRHDAIVSRSSTEQESLQPEGEWIRHENPFQRNVFHTASHEKAYKDHSLVHKSGAP